MDAKYLILFTAITDAIEKIDRLRAALVAAQQAAEDAYISEGEK